MSIKGTIDQNVIHKDAYWVYVIYLIIKALFCYVETNDSRKQLLNKYVLEFFQIYRIKIIYKYF